MMLQSWRNVRNSTGKLSKQQCAGFVSLCTFHTPHCAKTTKKARSSWWGCSCEHSWLSAACLSLLQVNLKKGVPPDSHNETCTAGAGSLLVEFGILSRLLGDSTFEWVARRAVKALWSLRSNNTGLLGNVWLLQATVLPPILTFLSSCSLCSCSVPCVPRGCVELMAPKKKGSL